VVAVANTYANAIRRGCAQDHLCGGANAKLSSESLLNEASGCRVSRIPGLFFVKDGDTPSIRHGGQGDGGGIHHNINIHR